MLKRFIGDKAFYKTVLSLAIPIMIQNGITNFVNMLDNIMIGSVGVVEMTGVAIANQLIFVFNLCIFGAVSGASIFGAQYFGKGDHKGVRDTFRFKIIICLAITTLGVAILYFFGDQLTSLYLTGEGNPEDAAASLEYARQYMLVMFIGLLPYTISQCYSGTLRETGQATIPMVAGVTAVFVNLVLNYVLIYGAFGAPRLGVIGAAIATVVSRFFELLFVALWTHLNKDKNKFIVGVYKSLKIPKLLVKQITIKGFPLLFNETMWAAGVAVVNQCYSTKGYDVVSANNINQTFFNVFGVAFMSVGAAIAIILGQMLGANKNKEAKDASFKLIAFSVFVSVVVSIIYYFTAEFIPRFYNVNDSVMDMATRLMQICALTMPFDAFAHASYFTLRSGGKTFITILFDSCFVWALTLPTAFILCNYTSLSIFSVYLICQLLNIIKDIAGAILVANGIWIKNIVD